MEIKTYETKRLFIRPTQIEDAHFIFELMNTPAWHKFIGDRNIKTVEDAKHYIVSKMNKEFKEKGFSNNTLIRKNDGVKIGTCGLYDREGIEGVDIGFALLPAYGKQGYAFEAASKMLQIANQEFGFNEISAITLETNFPSQNLLLKLGLTKLGIITLPGSDEELLLFKTK